MLTKRCLGYPRWYGHSSQFQELHAINLLKIRNFTKTALKQYFSNCKRLLRKTVGIFLRKNNGVGYSIPPGAPIKKRTRRCAFHLLRLY
jgi:hypothetical protein